MTIRVAKKNLRRTIRAFFGIRKVGSHTSKVRFPFFQIISL